MKNSLDFLESINVIDSSDFKGKFHIIDDTTEEGKHVLSLLGADYNRIYFAKNESHNDCLSQLNKLVENYNRSVLPGEDKIDLQQQILTKTIKGTFKREKSREFPALLYSLPKSHYPEVRLLCGATLDQVAKEVENDKTLTERITQAKEEAQLSKLFNPIEEGKRSEYQGFRLITKKASDGLYNAILDARGREIAELKRVERQDGNLRDTFAISFRFAKEDKESVSKAIKNSIGESSEIDFHGLKKFSDYINYNIDSDSVLFKNFANSDDRLKAATEDYDSVLRDNTSSIYDAEAEVARMSDPYESYGPIIHDRTDLDDFEMIVKNPSQSTKNLSLLPFAEEDAMKGNMELDFSKNELSEKLQDFQNKVALSEKDLRILMARIDVRSLTYFEEVRMDDLLKEVTEQRKEISGDVNRYTPNAAKDDDYLSYVKSMDKLLERLEKVDYSIKNYYGDEKYKLVMSELMPATERVQKEMEEQRKAKVESSEMIKNPTMSSVGYAQLTKPDSGKNGQAISSIPNFRCQIVLKDIESKIDKMNVTKHQDHERFNFAIIRNKNAKDEIDQFLVIAKRQGQPSFVNGKEVKFSDPNAIMEFSLDLKELKEKASKVGISPDASVPLIVGEEGNKPVVKINERSKRVTDKSQPSYFYKMTNGHVEIVNQFARIIQTRLNLNLDQKVRYEHKDLGDAIDVKRDNASKLIPQKSRDFFFFLNPKALKELPEADAFGNVRISICERKKDDEYLQANSLSRGTYGTLNQNGDRVPEYRVVADPIVYKNGQPYDNTRIELAVSKDEILKMPILKRDEDEVIALKISGVTGRVSMNIYQYDKYDQISKVNDYIRQRTGDGMFVHRNIAESEPLTLIDARCVRLSKEEAMDIMNSWQRVNKLQDMETFKKGEPQYEIYNSIVSEFKERYEKDINEKLETRKENERSNSQDLDKENEQDRKNGKKL